MNFNYKNHKIIIDYRDDKNEGRCKNVNQSLQRYHNKFAFFEFKIFFECAIMKKKTVKYVIQHAKNEVEIFACK